MKVKVNEREIELKWTFRALLIYEQLTNSTFEPKTLGDIVNFLFCIILGSDRDLKISFDDFLDWLDENPNAINEFAQWIEGELLRQKVLRPVDEEKEKPAKGGKKVKK